MRFAHFAYLIQFVLILERKENFGIPSRIPELVLLQNDETSGLIQTVIIVAGSPRRWAGHLFYVLP
jgi:hypothetical protein